MKKTNFPETSMDAFKKAHPDMLAEHYRKIIDALKILGTCNYEKIAAHATMDRHQVGRRLKELEGMELIYKPGTKSNTKSGRTAFDYCLTGSGQPKTDNEVRYVKGEKTAADYANDLINSAHKPEFKQTELFP